MQLRKALPAAIALTLPVMAGFLVFGTAYGVLMQNAGFGVGWVFLNSALVFAGSLQFVGIGLLTAPFDPLAALLMTLMVNARHTFYGISMLDRYRRAGWMKPYLIFALCDETFAVLCSAQAPPGVEFRTFALLVTFLNRWYWIVGCCLGAALGPMFSAFDTTGLEFALTALFFVTFLDQWGKRRDHSAALIGVACALISLLLFGRGIFLLPAMGMILLALTVRQPKTEGEEIG